MKQPSIRSRTTAFKTPWFEVTAKETALDSQPFYSLKVADYVGVVAITEEGEQVLVRQFRPAVEATTLELPSGLVDDAASPAEAAARELEEETGYRAESIELLGVTYADTGRLQNRIWYYLASGARPIAAAVPESGMEVVVKSPDAVQEAMRVGELSCALHYAAMMFYQLRAGRS